MNTQEIIAAIDAEIQLLHQARNLISGSVGTVRRSTADSGHKARRTFSTEARKKIAAAQRKRWAKQKQVTITMLPPKQAPVQRPRKPLSLDTKTALSGQIPSGPVAAPAPKSKLA